MVLCGQCMGLGVGSMAGLCWGGGKALLLLTEPPAEGVHFRPGGRLLQFLICEIMEIGVKVIFEMCLFFTTNYLSFI